MKITRKLVLNKETVKVLSTEELQKAAGGTSWPYETNQSNCSFCCVSGGSGGGGYPSHYCDGIC